MKVPQLAILQIVLPLALWANIPAAGTVPATGTPQIKTDPDQLWRSGKRFAEEGDSQGFAKAAELYRQAAEAGYAPAQCDLANLYAWGLGVETDLEQAARWYRRAAEQGDAEAQNDLGALYASGRGVPRNEVEAVRWYGRAAAQDDLEAATNLGMMYLRGRGVEADPVEAFQLLRSAALRGHPAAQNNLGLMYANGQGVAKDYVWAWAWLDIASGQLKASAEIRDQVAKEMTEEQRDKACQREAETRERLAQMKGR